MAQSIAIIDYGSGNLRSVAKAFERASQECAAEVTIRVTDDLTLIRRADRIVLPGVGAFAAAMAGLAARRGVVEALEHQVLIGQRPFLGICVGMQLLAEQGLEFGSHQGLGWVPGIVSPLAPSPGIRTPHMGWNKVDCCLPHSVFTPLDAEAFYFAHSYHFEPGNDAHAVAVSDHGVTLVAAVARDNILGVQFHPEKSQRAGLSLLSNFLNWSPS